MDYAALTASLAKTTKEAVSRKEKLRKQEAILAELKAEELEGVEAVQAFLAEAEKNAEAVKVLDDKTKDAEAAARARVEAAVPPLNKRIAELEAARAEKAKTPIGPVRRKLLESGRITWDDLVDKHSGRVRPLAELGYTKGGAALGR